MGQKGRDQDRAKCLCVPVFTNTPLLQTDSIVDQTKLDLEKIARDGLQLADAAAFKDLVKRKLVEKCKKFSFSVAKGPKFTLDVRQEEADITPEMLQSGNWKTATFKQYNFNAKGTPPDSGHLHPLLKVRSEFRQIFFELGYNTLSLLTSTSNNTLLLITPSF